ncbi:hypothetical protein [Aliiroseovarius crassostreae]|uniref:Uncharacterized protein n=1 Tax=Aliiroseovarius crassostreae TaxID=154981 RepID=A0A9Q9HG50_9RHOB|nr:hypothetical protein [Aliiroseovarius crassostreae]UWP96680.1 hypothetical protein K3X48_06810 [Aliiroseovarius crassostreae]UWP99796.1 hypothetical protein K3X53_06620 [Aliiroseovarius crassostreae]UWQ03011.1 hypothetical protein K3X44_06750 [Aliiroseovarius crassostreae]
MRNRNDTNGHQETALSRHHGFETAGPIAVTLAVWLALRFFLGGLGVAHTPILAIVGAAVFAVLWVIVRVRINKRKMAKASALRKELSELEQKEFALRYEEAQLNGHLDRWDREERS